MKRIIQINKIRNHFPILKREVNGKPLIYFDNAATVQKPKKVISSISDYYVNYNANVHRGIHSLSIEATTKMEEVRGAIKNFFNAQNNYQIIFTRGTTESINLVANGFSQILDKNDEILVSQLEHHSNIVPWQLACEKSGAKLKVIKILPNGELDMDSFEKLLNNKTKIVAINHVSNTLGTINPIKEIILKAKKIGAAVLIDGAQATAHIRVDVQDLDCDFYCVSAHKMYGPTGVGILYGKEEWLHRLPPYQGGGEMIKEVTFEKTTYADLPFKFEAGTPNIADIIAFGEAINFIREIGLREMAEYETSLTEYATEKLQQIPKLTIIGNAKHKTAVISFVIEGLHPFDIGALLDKMGIAVRTGHHCTQPIMKYYEIPGTVRISFAVYNTKEEIDYFFESLQKVIIMLE